MQKKSSATNNLLSPIFSIILLTVLLFIYATSAIGCKSRKNSNNNLSELASESENESSIDSTSTEGKMYAITDSWYKYKTVNKLVTEVYEKGQLVVKNEYDSDGYRIKKTAGDTVTTFKYDKEYQLIKEVCISNKTGTHTINYTYELQYSDIKGPKYKLTGFTYNGHNYTFKIKDDGRGIITAIYEDDKCVAEYEKENSLLKAVYEFKNGEKVRNDEPDFVGNLNRVLSEKQYFYDDETAMYLDKYLVWHSAYGNMTYHTREYETPKQTPIIWTPSNGDKYVYNDEKNIEKVINGDRVVEEYRYAEYKYINYQGVESDISLLSERITNDSVIRYEYFTGDDNTDYQCKLKSITIITNGKEHKLIYKYAYPMEPEFLGPYSTNSLSVSGFSYNGRNYKFEFANYDSYLITGIIDDKGNKIVSYKIENDGNIYYNRKTYEIKDGVEIENNSPDFIGNLNIVILDCMTYDAECGVNFGAIMYKK